MVKKRQTQTNIFYKNISCCHINIMKFIKKREMNFLNKIIKFKMIENKKNIIKFFINDKKQLRG